MDKKEIKLDFEAQIRDLRDALKKCEEKLSREILQKEEAERNCHRLRYQLEEATRRFVVLESQEVIRTRKEELKKAEYRICELGRLLDKSLMDKKEIKLDFEAQIRDLRDALKKCEEKLSREILQKEEAERNCHRLRYQLEEATRRFAVLESQEGVTTVIAETATRTPFRTEKKPSLTPTPNDTFQVPSFLRRKANPKNVVSIILGGGSGVQLFPLTKRAATPAVPVGGCYRLIDIPMSNCINSGINKVFVLTQFNSASLNRHISRTYFGNGINFGDGYVEVLDVEFHNVKALYRRAQAYIETGDFLLADVDIKKALEVDPQNREVKTLKTKVKQLQADSDKKDAKLYENMFAHKPKRLKVEKEEDEVVKTEMDNVGDSAAPSNGGLIIDSC
ncbi:hypothetical protein KIW84_014101 [Lathyrus oleraceus]|uniref:Nucleotidyl transferase domain-containing protein n=2 Tax=Pisum sativum TaxID=3888 RepID=A0A9D5GZ27_PEA|nr:hypothetical protein KIW84_014101 [Pisum sativum]